MGEYNHADHGEIEWYEFNGYREQIEGWRCVDCHVIAELEDADEVFDEHDCEQYERIRKGVTGAL